MKEFRERKYLQKQRCSFGRRCCTRWVPRSTYCRNRELWQGPSRERILLWEERSPGFRCKPTVGHPRCCSLDGCGFWPGRLGRRWANWGSWKGSPVACVELFSANGCQLSYQRTEFVLQTRGLNTKKFWMGKSGNSEQHGRLFPKHKSFFRNK